MNQRDRRSTMSLNTDNIGMNRSCSVGRSLIPFLALLVAVVVSPLSAQTTAPPVAVPNVAEDLLQSLQEFRKLQNTAPDLTLPSANNVPGEDPYQQRLRSIQQRMELIRSLVQQKQAAEEQARLKASQNALGSQTANQNLSPSQAQTVNIGDSAATEQPEESEVGAAPPAFPMPDLMTKENAADPASNANPAPKFVGETVVPSAVDPLELANSLFQTGNYDLALKTYLAVADKLDKPHDVIWTDYFIASCQRILGDLPAAEKGYRSLVESRRPTRPVEAARWWLDNVERRKSIATTLSDLDASLTAVSKELKTNGSKK